MNNQRFPILLGIAFCAIAVLLFLNSMRFFPDGEMTTPLPPDSVRGIAAVYDGRPYTLNFEQQQKMVVLINQLKTVPKREFLEEKKPSSITKMEVYLFENPEPISFLPFKGSKETTFFQIPLWDTNLFFQEATPGSFEELFEEVVPTSKN